MWTLITVCATVCLIALVLRFMQPELIYAVRRGVAAVTTRRAFLEYDAKCETAPNKALAASLMGGLRYEMRFCSPDYAIERVGKLRELYRVLDPRRSVNDGLGQRQRPQVCIIELANLLGSLGRRIDVHVELNPPVIGSAALLLHIANQIRKSEGYGALSLEELELWLTDTPISIEQSIEIVSAAVIALAYRLRQQESADHGIVGSERQSEASVWAHVQRVERILRALARRQFQRRYGDELSAILETKLGKQEYLSCVRVMAKSRHDVTGIEADVVDFLTLSQLKKLLLSEWDEFQPILGDQAEFEAGMVRIIAARNNMAHAHHVAMDESAIVTENCHEIFSRVARYLHNR